MNKVCLKNILVLLSIFIFFACPIPNNPDPVETGKWVLIWYDEFNGPDIDDTKWSFDIGNGFFSGSEWVRGWGNEELEYYTDNSKNSFIHDGALIIKAINESTTETTPGAPEYTYDYTSAKLKTKGKFSNTYGRYEIRAKLPSGAGLWPAIWMLSENDPYGNWAGSGEIDIMEAKGSNPDQTLGTIHYGAFWPNNVYSGGEYDFPTGESFTDYHIYAIEWVPGEIRWYVDNVLFHTENFWYSQSDISTHTLFDYPAPFDTDFYLILNLAVGGRFDGNPDGSYSFPQQMEVDYVRVYDWSKEYGPAGERPDGEFDWDDDPNSDVSPVLFSSVGGPVASSLVNMWDTKTSIISETDDTMGKIFRVYTDPASLQPNTWGTVLAFSNIDEDLNFMENYGQLTFKIKSDDFVSVVVSIPGVENEYTITDGESLGNGWYKVTVPLIDYLSSSDSQVAIFQHTSVATGTFYITDIEFSGAPIASSDLPTDGGYVYAPTKTQTIFFNDISPWDSGSILTEVVDAEYGTVMEVAHGTNWGPTQCLSFMGIGKIQMGIYYEKYSTLKFKINSLGSSNVKVYVKGLTTIRSITDGIDLGNGWYEVSVPLIEVLGEFKDDGQIAFLVDSNFKITDVELTGTPAHREPLPEAGGYLYSPTGTTSVFFADISPWDCGATLQTITDPVLGDVMNASGGVNWGATQCIAFMGIGQVYQTGKYYEEYSSFSFKIKSDGNQNVKVYAKGLEKVYSITSGISLGDGWYHLTIPFSDFSGTPKDDGQIAFLVDSSFSVTDILFIQ